MRRRFIEPLEDGVAYFDDRDAPMVILRGAVKPALLSEAGVPMDRRFTFFDQAWEAGKTPVIIINIGILESTRTYEYI